jgi:hypothetical protein
MITSYPANGKSVANGGIPSWLDAQHQYAAIAPRPRQRPARHVVAEIADTGRTRPTPRPIPRQGAAGAVGRVVAGPAAAYGRGGRGQVRP